MSVKISNTNGNSNQHSCVRIYVNKICISELYVNKHDPLGYLNTLTASKYHIQLCDDLDDAMCNELCTFDQAQIIKKSVFSTIHGSK